MSLLNRAIAALFNGVSQQPPALRAESQAAVVDNAYVTVAEGVRKRPPLVHVAKITSSTPENAKVHRVFRDESEQYVMIVGGGISSGSLIVADGNTGATLTVDTTTFPNVLDYLACSDPIADIDMVTVADTTFIVNRKKTVAMSGTAPAAPAPTLYLYVKEGRAEATYTVVINSTTVTFTATTSASSYASTNVAEQLKVGIAAISGFTATRYGNLVVAKKSDNSTFTYTVSDSNGNNLMTAFLNRVERYTDLPRSFVDGAVVEVRGTADSNRSGYWVKFVSDVATSGSGGHWEETVAPKSAQYVSFDATTMPVALVRLTSTTFRLTRPSWNSRLVGDTDTTVKLPSFVGDTIYSVFFWRDRLGFLAGENVIFSRAGDIYNLFPKSAVQVNDDDPIDVTVNAPKIATLRHAVPFQRNLVLFSDSVQFQVTSDGPLTPRTIRVDNSTEFDCSPVAKPVSSGRDIFFSFSRTAPDGGVYSGLREFYVDANAVSNAANDVSAHVPQFVPKDVHRLSVSSTEDLVLALNRTDYSQIHCYKFLWNGDERVQSAWFRWYFIDAKVLSADLNQSSVFIVSQRSDGVYLERIDLPYAVAIPGIAQGGKDFNVHLDRRVKLTGSYNAILNETSWTLPYAVTNGTIEGVLGAEWGTRSSRRLTAIYRKSSTVYAMEGDWSAFPVYLGLVYILTYTFSTFYMRDRKDQAIETGRLQIRYLTAKFRDSGYFAGWVETPGRNPAKYVWSPLRLGTIGLIVDYPVTTSGTFAFPVASKADRATVYLENDSPYPSCFYAAEWEGVYTNRAVRA